MHECKNPVYTAPDESAIDVEYNHPEFGWIPFTARPDDIEPLGVEIYNAALAGEYGPIAPYDGPSEQEILESEMRGQRDSLLSELDAFVSNPLRWASLSAEQQQELADYRQALLDVPQQEGFPDEIDWPEFPELES